MINVIKQIEYWQTGAEEEMLNAQVMIENKRYLAGLFFCHLSIEKILKALVVKITEDHPPRTHDLERLSVIAQITLDDEQMTFLTEMQVFQIEGRYPENFPNPNAAMANDFYEQTLKMHQWLRQKL